MYGHLLIPRRRTGAPAACAAMTRRRTGGNSSARSTATSSAGSRSSRLTATTSGSRSARARASSMTGRAATTGPRSRASSWRRDWKNDWHAFTRPPVPNYKVPAAYGDKPYEPNEAPTEVIRKLAWLGNRVFVFSDKEPRQPPGYFGRPAAGRPLGPQPGRRLVAGLRPGEGLRRPHRLRHGGRGGRGHGPHRPRPAPRGRGRRGPGRHRPRRPPLDERWMDIPRSSDGAREPLGGCHGRGGR